MTSTLLRPDTDLDLDLTARFAGIVDELTRRGFLGVGAGTAALVGLAACGTDKAAPQATAPSTRTIETAKGRVRVPATPRRVVCLDPGFSWQTLLEVGLTPVGLPFVLDSLVQPVNLAKVRGVASAVTSAGEPDLERIASLRPDLILASSGSDLDKVYGRLTAIAPVAAYAFDYPSDWIELAHEYANAVNRVQQLASVEAAYQAKVAQLKAQHGTTIAAQRWALVTESDKQVYVWGARSSAGPVLADAGAAFSSGAPGDGSPYTQLSLEKLDTLSDATVILYGQGTDGKPYLDTGSLLDEPGFKLLPAVKAGHVYPLPSWFAYCYQDAVAQVAGIAAACQRLEAGR